MTNLIVFLLVSLPLLFATLTIIIPSTFATFISSCNEPCQTLEDCDGHLTCINGICNDDPEIDVNSHTCRGRGRGGNDWCRPSGTLTCWGYRYPTYKCSPRITSETRAKLIYNDFSQRQGEDGWLSSKCDRKYHSDSERVVALSTGWYDGGSRCGKRIKIRAGNGRTTTAKVVGECDSRRGCDREHGYQPPCMNNIVVGSDAVWRALRLDRNVGIEDITWYMD